jgi:hypothetical protein
MSLAHEMGLLLGVIPALLDAAIKLANPIERLTLPEGRIVVTVAGRPMRRSPADALALAERCADELRMLCQQAGHGAAGGVPVDSCGAIKAELIWVRVLAMQARAGSEEAAA